MFKIDIVFSIILNVKINYILYYFIFLVGAKIQFVLIQYYIFLRSFDLSYVIENYAKNFLFVSVIPRENKWK